MGKIFFAVGVCVVLAASCALSAQSQITGGFPDYFPEASEIGADSRAFSLAFENAADLVKVKNGRLASNVGFTRYERADYSGAAPLSIEVFTLLDSYAAYSLLTLLRDNHIHTGPPGAAYTIGDDVFLFARGRIFVRILGKGAPKELLERSAAAVSAKMGTSSGEPPRLPDYFPPDGYAADSMKYFPSPEAYKTWAGDKTPEYIDTNYDMEIAAARYSTGSYSGTFYLMKFPNPELAEGYYDDLAVLAPTVSVGLSLYAGRVGPLVAVLEGDFDPVSAGRLLSAVKFSYSMHWVYGEEPVANVIWGVPVVVLKAVVGSLIFSAIAVVAAILTGLALGGGRYALRQYKGKRSPQLFKDESGITRLNLWKR